MRRIRRVPLAVLAIGFIYLVVVAWSSTWPDHPLTPDEAIAKVTVDSVARDRTPFATEPFEGYSNGAFGPEPYDYAFQNGALVFSPVGFGVAWEQGALGAKVGRAITLAVGLVSVAYLAWRLHGELAAVFASALYVTHPAVLYFHGTYFANSGGSAYFLASLALLEASRRRHWLAATAVLALVVSILFRVEYAAGILVLAAIAAFPGPLRSVRGALWFYVPLGVFVGSLWYVARTASSRVAEVLFAEHLDLQEALSHPVAAVRAGIGRYARDEQSTSLLAEGSLQNLTDYFVYFFPLVSLLALVGLFVRSRRRSAQWVLVPLAAQSLLMGYAILPALVGADPYYMKSWLEGSMVRYFLVTHAMLALLAGVALAATVPWIGRVAPLAPRPLVATVLVVLLCTASVSHAVQADHGLVWANERRAWFDDVDRAAAAFGENAVFVGATPTKVVFSRPVLSTPNVAHDRDTIAHVALDLISRGHAVFALEPWYWDDHGHSVARALLHGGRTYWTDTGVQVDCTCGEFARFYQLHRTNASLHNVERLELGHFEETPDGLKSLRDLSKFYEERSLHVRHGLGEAGPVTVRFEFWDADNASHEAGYNRAGHVNLPADVSKNVHTLVKWSGEGTRTWREVSFTVPAGDVVNGPYFISGDLTIRALEVREG